MDKKKIQKVEEISKEVEQELSDFDILDVILDENNTDELILQNEQGKQIRFEQVAVIPYNEKIYVILKPIDKIEGVEDDQAIVFLADETKRPTVLVPEADEATAIKVFDEYYNLVEEANKNAKKKGKK
ncbi:MAG TPA: DUF1292 domain-containing protein [Candidatus Caccovivens faecavium]|nr:DUF1292 domain-containing protein [Candidatus Caccovivens faecavium]